MWLTALFLRRPTLAFVLIAVVLLAGFLALRSLVVQELPDVSQPGVGIGLNYSGASTTELRDTIGSPIEDQLAGTPDLDHIDSTIQTGTANINAVFTLGSDPNANLTNVQKALQAAQAQLPSDLLAPTVRVANQGEPVVVSLAASSRSLGPSQLSAIAKNQVQSALESIPGVANVNVAGLLTPAFEVHVEPSALVSSGLTLTDVVSSLSGNNTRAPGGIAYGPGRETQIDVRGDITNVASIAGLLVPGGGTPVTTSASAAGGSSSVIGTTAATTSSGAAGSASVSSSALAQNGGGAGSASFAQPAAGPVDAGTGPVQTQAGNVSGSASQTMTPETASSSGPVAGGSAGGLGASNSTTAGVNGSTSTLAAGNTTLGTQSNSAGGGFGTTAAAASAGAVNLSGAPATALGSTATNGSATGTLPTMPSIPGGGAGVTSSQFVGQLDPWTEIASLRKIGDVAKVVDGSEPQRVYAYLSGAPGLGIDVQKSVSASEVTVANEIAMALPRLAKQFPQIVFRIEHVQAQYTREQVDGVEHTLLEAVGLTAIVMLFFLRSWRNALVVMVAIPTSLAVAVVAMSLLHMTLDTISLLGMTLVIGILVDDSIVVLENIERHAQRGEEPLDAAYQGRSEIGPAAIVITLVDVVVFLPIAFIGGAVGRQLSEFGLVVAVSTLASLVVSFTITPTLAGTWALASRWKPWPIIELFTREFDRVRSVYEKRTLPWALGHRTIVLGFATLTFVGALFLVPTGIVGEDYIPQGDQGEIFVQVSYAPGTPLETVRQAIRPLERRIDKISDLEGEQTTAGGRDASFGGFVQEGNTAQIHIWLKEKRAQTTDHWVSYIDNLASRMLGPSAQVVVKPVSAQAGGPKQPIDELVGSTDGSDPSPYANKVLAALRATPGTTIVNSSSSNLAPQVEVLFDRQAAQALNVSIGTASTAIRAAFGGALATQIESPQGRKDVQVIYPFDERHSLKQVMAIPIRSNAGAMLRVGDIAKLREAPAPLLLTRENRQNVIHVDANIAAGYALSNVTADLQRRIAALHLPANTTVRAAAQGQQDLMRQTLSALGSSLVLSVVLVYLLMVALYNSYRSPLIVLFSIPLATVGALGSLAILHETLNLFSLIGTVLLVGLAAKNGILLVDYADTLRREGRSRREAICESAATRFRPIVMTTASMVGGMLPLALALEPGASIRSSLGVVVIGGLLSSLALTLLVIPIVYSLLAPSRLPEPRRLKADLARPSAAR